MIFGAVFTLTDKYIIGGRSYKYGTGNKKSCKNNPSHKIKIITFL